jgi:predicted GIY-YIG superfamily endonuclease
MVYIYVLKLEQEKYYIGKTNNPQFRLDNHFTSNGSEWTKLYKPVFLLEL